MMRSAAVLVVGIALAMSFPVTTGCAVQPAPTGRWTLAFSDDFDGGRLDPGKWTTCYWWDRNGCTNLGNRELEWYRPENVVVGNSQVRLVARPASAGQTPGRKYPYTSGLISTGRDTYRKDRPVRFAFHFGYAEMRARIPAGRGLHPAFWMLPVTHDELPEIDVMEVVGDRPGTLYTNFHYRDDAGRRHASTWSAHVHDLSAGWNTYAVDWRPDRLTWYLNGRKVREVTERAHIPDEPMYLLVNLAVGGNWPGSPDASTKFPADMAVDYLRVWVPAN